MKYAPRFLLAAATAAMLSSCGGGGDDAGSGPNVAFGLYNGSGGANRAFKALVLDSGRSYLIYGRTSASAIPVGGVVVGDVAVNGTAVASTNARDFNIESHVMSPATLVATVAPRTSLNGTLTGGTAAASTFAFTYDTAFDGTPSLATVAGSYVGEMAEIAGTQPSVLNIDATTGVLTGTTTAGCNVAGLVSTYGSGNVYEITMSFQTGCAEAGRTLKGHAFRSGNQLYAVVVSGDLSRAVVWAGART